MFALQASKNEGSACRVSATRIVIMSWALALAATPSASVARDAGSSLICSDPKVSNDSLVLYCRLRNTFDQEIFISMGPAILEGPLSGQEPFSGEENYIYFFVGGDRYENVLQYHRAEVGDLDMPILFKPCVHMNAEDITKLTRIPQGNLLEIEVQWEFGEGVVFASGEEWLVLLKIIYITTDSINRLLKREDLSESCCAPFNRTLDSEEHLSSLKLVAIPAGAGRRCNYDGCANEVSLEFRHMYSNTVRFSPH